jgi:hypothetical protein
MNLKVHNLAEVEHNLASLDASRFKVTEFQGGPSDADKLRHELMTALGRLDNIIGVIEDGDALDDAKRLRYVALLREAHASLQGPVNLVLEVIS